MVTHDRYFLDRVATRIVEVDQGNYTATLEIIRVCQVKSRTSGYGTGDRKKEKESSAYRTRNGWEEVQEPGSTKQKAHIDRIKAMQEIKDIQEEKKVVLDSVASRMGNKTMKLQNISKILWSKKADR